eukprot:COSAG06_NODE_23016_length_705_cov_0.960396_2_plen_32_part_01
MQVVSFTTRVEMNPGKEGTIDGELEPHRVDPR